MGTSTVNEFMALQHEQVLPILPLFLTRCTLVAKMHARTTHSRPHSSMASSVHIASRNLIHVVCCTSFPMLALSAGVLCAGFIALTGDLPGTIGYLKACGPLVTIPLKAAIAFPLVYHYVAGVLFQHSACVSKLHWVVLSRPDAQVLRASLVVFRYKWIVMKRHTCVCYNAAVHTLLHCRLVYSSGATQC
jgi:hypothetical protein